MSKSGDDDDHLVASEVNAELCEASGSELQPQSPGSTAGSGLKTVVVRRKPLATQFEDSDGDLDLPRAKKQRTTVNSMRLIAKKDSDSGGYNGSERHGKPYLKLLVRSQTSWRAAGAQIWRAALLLAELIEARPDWFVDATVLELGCGVGLGSIIAARVARCVVATDSDAKALSIAQRNIQNNCMVRSAVESDKHHQSGATIVKCIPSLRVFDWNNRELPWQRVTTTSDTFSWSPEDVRALGKLDAIIASDVFYDEDTSQAFLQALHSVMLTCDRPLTVVLTLERRPVFSAATMSIVSLGFDTFQAHLCTHSSETCHTRTGVNQVLCHGCSNEVTSAESTVRFIAHQYPVDDIPHVFAYEKVSTLMAWIVDAAITARQKRTV